MAAVAGKLGSGAMPAVVENVFVSGKINGGIVSGAFAGAVEGTSTLKNVFAQADVNSEFDAAAGLVGYVNADLSIENAYFAGKVSTEQPIVAAGEDGKAAQMRRVVNWTSYADTYAPYSFNGSNHADLQKTVVAFDPAVWACTMKASDYPVLKAFGDVIPDAIQNVELNAQSTIFDLQGRKVSKTQKGLYIQNGKGVVK